MQSLSAIALRAALIVVPLAVAITQPISQSRTRSVPPAKAANAGATDTARYTVLTASRPSGQLKVWNGSASAHYAFFEFNDRGRGPRLVEKMVLDPRGIPVTVEITGHDYLKNSVDERCRIENGRVTWKNSAESGSSPAGAFYVPLDATPEASAVLARALLAAPGHKLAVLPGGEARIDRVGELTIRVNGQTRSVVQYTISGLGFTPDPIWLERNGDFFASGSTWLMVIRRGWESALPRLVKAQDAAATQRTTELAKTLGRIPNGALVFRNATLFDAKSKTMRPRTTVVISGSRITAVGPDDSIPVPTRAEMIDAGGKALLPGLWDMHVHTGDDDGLLHIAAGVTTVRDLANDTDELIARRRRFAERALIGPRILMAGFMDGPGPYAGPTKVLVSTPEEVRAAVEKYASLGFEQIKLYSSIRPDLVPVIIEEAHKKGLRVSGHVPAYMTAEQMVRMGADEIQHANFLFLNFWGDSVKDTRTPLRFTAVAERAAALDLSSPRVREFVRLLKARDVVSDPTVNVFEDLFVARKGAVSPGYTSVAGRMPPQVRRNLLRGGLPVPPGMNQRYKDSFANMLRFVKLLHDSGVRIVAGTDALPGFALHRELELYAEAGIPTTDVLYIATLGAARVMKHDAEWGSIEPGKLADVILIDGNPAERMRDIRRTALVVKDGVVYEPGALYQALGVRPMDSAPVLPATRD